jgi:hypothetical protein
MVPPLPTFVATFYNLGGPILHPAAHKFCKCLALFARGEKKKLYIDFCEEHSLVYSL